MSQCVTGLCHNVTLNVNKFGMRSLAEEPQWAWLHIRGTRDVVIVPLHARNGQTEGTFHWEFLGS